MFAESLFHDESNIVMRKRDAGAQSPEARTPNEADMVFICTV